MLIKNRLILNQMYLLRQANVYVVFVTSCHQMSNEISICQMYDACMVVQNQCGYNQKSSDSITNVEKIEEKFNFNHQN